MDDFQASMMEIFAFETNGFLESIERILLDNEGTGTGIKTSVPEIFRIMHTIKSSSAMMSLDNISKMAHTVEDLFYYIRENNPESVDYQKLTDIVLECVDFIKRNMSGGSNETPDKIIETARRFLHELKTPALPEQIDASTYNISIKFKEKCQMLGLRAFEIQNKLARIALEIVPYPENIADSGEDYVAKNGFFLQITSIQPLDEIKAIIMKSPFVESINENAQLPVNEQLSDSDSDRKTTANNDKIEASPSTDTQTPSGFRADGTPFVERRADRHQSGSFINVPISKLDNLINLAGEILVAELALLTDFENQNYVRGMRSIAVLKKLLLEIQEAALSTRMIPVKDTFHKLNRLVRDMCRKQEKEVDFIITGENTEVDRSIAEAIFSPLMHMIRNSVDHGIEPAEKRLESRKPAVGKIELDARTEGRNIIITITDDGAGLNRDKIINKAISRGLINEHNLHTMTDEEINGLIFMPGFSTNENVTEFSGRGVGMDVVNENIKKMNGSVTITTQHGKGTCITLKIPLTMAIIDAVLVKIYDEVYTLPMSVVGEVFKVGDGIPIRQVNGSDVVMLREECYRIVNLFSFFSSNNIPSYKDGIMLLIKIDNKKYALFVNEIVGRQNIVVKPVPTMLKSIKGLSGCTVLGDGRICLILDASELINRKDEAAYA